MIKDNYNKKNKNQMYMPTKMIKWKTIENGKRLS
jgi:hypothetical protein